jgi:hypothetical protein
MSPDDLYVPLAGGHSPDRRFFAGASMAEDPLHEKVRRAQIAAGERVVLDHLAELGLAERRETREEFLTRRLAERGEEVERLKSALRDVRDAILTPDPAILTDTLWVSDIETAVDRINAVLNE